jgi:tRNA dimethylallyltransferase
MIRALEVHELTGKPMSVWQTQWRSDGDSAADAAILCLDLPRKLLYERVNRRVEAMFAAGLIEEARQLRALEKPLSLEASQAVGYKELFALLDGAITRDEAILRVQLRTRRYAKRQIAWFRRLPVCRAATIELTRTLWAQRMKSSR